jgi:predicted RNA-binding protein YlqC (UPF0109 family)
MSNSSNRAANAAGWLGDLLRPLTREPDAFNIRATEAGHTVVLSIAAPRHIRGAFIGQGGRLIASLRELARTYSSVNSFTLTIQVVEPDKDSDHAHQYDASFTD